MTRSVPNLIIPVLNRYDLLNRAIATIDYPVDHLLIIDNGGKFEQTFGKPEGEHIGQGWVITMPANLGVADSWNLGIKAFPHAPFWTFGSNDMWLKPGTLAEMAKTEPNEIRLSNSAPFWQAFTIGEEVIRDVGLFCPGFHPAYFEDNDYERRADVRGYPAKHVYDVGHDNSSTLNSSRQFKERNAATFQANHELFIQRTKRNEMWAGEWSLKRRRELDWVR